MNNTRSFKETEEGRAQRNALIQQPQLYVPHTRRGVVCGDLFVIPIPDDISTLAEAIDRLIPEECPNCGPTGGRLLRNPKWEDRPLAYGIDWTELAFSRGKLSIADIVEKIREIRALGRKVDGRRRWAAQHLAEMEAESKALSTNIDRWRSLLLRAVEEPEET